MLNKKFMNFNEFDLVIYVSKKISSKEALLEFYAEKLKFPSYAGHNWDALYSCLCDLNWLKIKSIAIVHESLPLIDPDDLKLYLKLLNDVEKSWENDPQKKVFIFIPQNKKKK